MPDLRKTVEGATKPKRAAPKAKYIDPIVQATFNQDGALQEIVRTLGVRMRDPNSTVVFKSLITLHTVMRSGSLDPVFTYLSSSSSALSLSGHAGGNIAAYGHYLAARIKSYGNLKRDVVRDKSDRRAANRLRSLGVEQGLLRETREIQRMIATLVEAKFYQDDVDDDVSMTALRLLVKDLLVLFTCVNEGIINILENFFSMSAVDGQTALKIYKTFCRDTERVVGFLGTAKKLYNVLNIPIPNLKHAPVSLAKSLEEYLNDPNFEQNRAEYKENKRIADGGTPRATPKPAAPPSSSTSTSAPSTSVTSPASARSSQSAAAPKNFTDFFDSIEQAQTPMFNPNTGSPTLGYFQQQAAFNPFLMPQPTGAPFAQQGMLPQATGMPFGAAAPNPFLQPQMTGFPVQPQMTGMQLQPQMTGMMGANPFRQSMMPTGMGAPNPFMSINTGNNGLAPQTTGMQPFSAPPPVPTLQPQPIGSPFGAPPSSSPFGQPPQQQPSFLSAQPTGNPSGAQRPMSMMPQATGNPFQRPMSSMPASTSFSSFSPAASSAPGQPPLGAPASSPSPFSSAPSPLAASSPAPLTAQKTGTRNPFAPAPGTLIPQAEPPQPKGPSMNDLAANSYAQRLQAQQTGMGQLQPQQTGYGGANGIDGTAQQPPQNKPQDAFSLFLAEQNARREREAQQQQQNGAGPLIAQKTGGVFASIASDFVMNRDGAGMPSADSSTVTGASSPFSSAFSSGAPFSAAQSSTATGTSSLSPPFSSLSLSSQPTGATSSLSSQPTGATASFTPQATGFGGSSVKPFQPISSFGSQLATQMPAPSPLSSSASPAPLTSQPTGFGNSFNPSPAFASSAAPSPAPAASPAPVQPQATGYNPFSGTKLPPLNTPLSAGLTPQRTGFQPTSDFGKSAFGGGGAGGMGMGGEGRLL
ncbi:hypothetical protein JCM11641_004121 [Rhodosporidiobolus odoratus]